MKTTLGLINVKKTLNDRSAWFCVNKMWGEQLDALGINEWEDERMPILRSHGTILTPQNLKTIKYPEKGPVYCNTKGGGLVLGLMADRFKVSHIGTVKLYDGAKVFPAEGQKDFEPTRFGLEVFTYDVDSDDERRFFLYHLPAHVEKAGHYAHPKDPRVKLHRQGADVVEEWFVKNSKDAKCFTMGDDNWHQMQYKNIVESWQRKSFPTCGRRDIDNIGAWKKPVRTYPVLTTSDHNGRVSVYA